VPILQPEPARFPENLLAEDTSPPDLQDRKWYALHTRPRQEKSLARDLFQRAIAFYLPLVPRRNHIRGKILTSLVPLFPGYVFLLAGRDDYVTTLATSRVVRALPVPDQERLHSDLRQVYRLIENKDDILLQGALTPGVLVEIIAGPLAGLKGKIVRRNATTRFVVEVEFIRQGASVEVDESTIHRLE
jgi:transcriptional antiterminator RfaH